MNRIEVSTLGFNLTKDVPSTNDEYNALAPKRDNPVLEDAVANILYRNTFASFRGSMLDLLEKETGITRNNSGTEEEPQFESDGKLIKRMIAASGSTKEAFVAQYQSLAQSTMDAAPFNPAERENKGTTNLVGKRDLATAQDAIDKGLAEKLAGLLGRKLSREVAADVKSLATAIKDNRAILVAAAEAAQAAELAGA